MLSSLLNAILAGMSKASQMSSAQGALPGESGNGISVVPISECVEACRHSLQLLAALTNVSRFDMTAMCISSKEKDAIRMLWNEATARLDEAVVPSGIDLEKLKKRYRL
jgi:hypothetical protein